LYAGVGEGGPSLDVPSEWSRQRLLVPMNALAGGATYDVRIQMIDEARLITMLCREIGSSLESDYGLEFIRNATLAPITRSYREVLGLNATVMWKHNAAHLLNWWDHNTTTSSSSSSYSDVQGGYVLDTTLHNTVAQTAVPVKLAVYASTASGSGGKVKVINESGGATIAEVTGIGTTAQWYTATGTIPAGETTVKIQLAGDGSNACTLKNVSLFEAST
jgi:hypothetical protein